MAMHVCENDQREKRTKNWSKIDQTMQSEAKGGAKVEQGD